MSDLHCPANLSSIAGESNSGLRDGRKSLFQNPSLLCIYANLIFVCDSGNASISVIDISRLVSSKEDTGHLPYQILFCIQPREPGSTVTTASLLGEPNPEENNGPRNL